MNQAEQKAKYAEGTVIEVSGYPIKAENGRFVIDSHFPDQSNGEAYFQWTRLGKSGAPLKGISTNNMRGRRFSWLEAHAKIVG